MDSITVILPYVSDVKKLTRFCTSVFSYSNIAELLLCHIDDSEALAEMDSSILNNIKAFSGNDNYSAFCKAISEAKGDYILISDINCIYAPDAFIKMTNSGKACACNIGFTDGNKCDNLFRENFTFDELASRSKYSNYLLKTDVIRQNQLLPKNISPFEILSFIAAYSVYDEIESIHETLVYTDLLIENESVDFSFCPDASFFFKASANDKSTYFYLRNVISRYISNPTEDSFYLIKESLIPFSDSYATVSWINSTFHIDTELLYNADSKFEDFEFSGRDIYYKEKTMPLIDNDVVMNFYAGKFGVNTLKCCIAAWAYYKLYRRKNGIIKNFGCKLCKRLLGGDFNV
ncbi:MAG: hypothetical protein PUB20_01300 [Clostridia bacterium]|nr:hypothetical protein [Clostridia bacterium]